MKKIYSAEALFQVTHIKNVLEREGIACLIKNERLAGALGEVPFIECWPELWVRHDRDAHRALGIIEELRADTEEWPDWTCRHCGTKVDGHFAACWQCGREHE